MILFDVNVIVCAHREEAADHSSYRGWLEGVLNSEAAYGVSDLVLSGFLRVVTNRRIFEVPTPLDQAIGFCDAVRGQPNSIRVSPGERHWEIFAQLCRTSGAKGGLVPDAYLAALAIESGAEWITTDRDYARFPGLRWRHPLAE